MRQIFMFLGDIAELTMVFIGVCACLGIIYLSIMQWRGANPRGVVSLDPYDNLGSISCESYSMGMTLRCNDTTLLRVVDDESALIPGHIYIYSVNSTRNVVHRYVQKINQTIVLFKGDNNKIGELINRTQVKYEVIGVFYEGTY